MTNEITTAEVIAWFEHRREGITMSGARRMYEKALTILRGHQAIETRVWATKDNMTIEEAIETVEYAAAFNADNSPLTKALGVLISAARKQQEHICAWQYSDTLDCMFGGKCFGPDCDGRKPIGNEPLTLEELRELGGKPVWVEYKDHFPHWALVQTWPKSKKWDLEVSLVDNFGFTNHIEREPSLAPKPSGVYLHKPKEGLL